MRSDRLPARDTNASSAHEEPLNTVNQIVSEGTGKVNGKQAEGTDLQPQYAALLGRGKYFR